MLVQPLILAAHLNMNIDMWGFEMWNGWGIAPTLIPTSYGNWGSSTSISGQVALSGKFGTVAVSPWASQLGTPYVGYGPGRAPATGAGGGYSLGFFAAVSGITGSGIGKATFPMNTPKPCVGAWIYMPNVGSTTVGDIVEIGGASGLRLYWAGGSNFTVYNNATSLGTFTSTAWVSGTWIYVGFDYVPGVSIRFKVGQYDSGVLATTFNTQNTTFAYCITLYLPGTNSASYWYLDDVIYNDASLDDGSGTNMGQPYLLGDCRVLKVYPQSLASTANTTVVGAASIVAALTGAGTVNMATSGNAKITPGTIVTTNLADQVVALKLIAQNYYNASPITAHTINIGTTLNGVETKSSNFQAGTSYNTSEFWQNWPSTLAQFNAGTVNLYMT